MTTQNLSRVTLETLENYRAAATHAVLASRAGGHRLLQAVNGTLENQVYPRTARLAPRATERMNEVRGSVSGIVVKGIDQASERTERVIELGSEAAAAQLTKVAGYAAEIDNRFIAGGLQAAARATLPVARLGLAVSGKVAEGAAALAGAAGAAGAEPAKKAAKKAVRRAGVAAKGVAQRAGKAVAKTANAPKVQRARRAINKAAAAQ